MEQDKTFMTKNMNSYARRKTIAVHIGNQIIGSDYPILVQSMATVDTNLHEEACIQAQKIFDSGAPIVRFTTQGIREAQSLGIIRKMLIQKGYDKPLVADIHFNQKAAFEAATQVEKVRINPGNFVDKRAVFKYIEYTDQEYAEELAQLEARFVEFLDICKKHNTAIRIGVNHGSLSDRIMSRYGDTPDGMTHSAMEFLRICKKQNFDNVVVSMKSSNTATMVIACRLLCSAMNSEQMHYPLHLGVTEAGEGNDGRIRSAVGIGALLNDGIGDTLRVSLTENPENEVPVAQKLVDYYSNRKVDFDASMVDFSLYNPYGSNRTKTDITKIVFDLSSNALDINYFTENYPNDYIYIGEREFNHNSKNIIRTGDQKLKYVNLDTLKNSSFNSEDLLVVECSSYQEQRAVCIYINQLNIQNTVILKKTYRETDYNNIQLWASADLGGLLIDGFGDAIWISTSSHCGLEDLPLSILQSSRRRVSKAEYISCPGCGRTLYDLQKVVREVKERTQGLKNIKIAIMGCIVNGPGEMADADYGYVGASRGLVTLYKHKEIVEQNIPQEIAIDKLIELIKSNGDWK